MKMFQHKRCFASETCSGEYGYLNTQLGQGISGSNLDHQLRVYIYIHTYYTFIYLFIYLLIYLFIEFLYLFVYLIYLSLVYLFIYIACIHPINEESFLGTSAQVSYLHILAQELLKSQIYADDVQFCRNGVVIGRHSDTEKTRNGKVMFSVLILGRVCVCVYEIKFIYCSTRNVHKCTLCNGMSCNSMRCISCPVLNIDRA